MGEHVVGCVAAVVERGLGVVIVLGDENFRDAGQGNFESATFAGEANNLELGTWGNLSAGVMQRIDFGVDHERVLVRFELVVRNEGA